MPTASSRHCLAAELDNELAATRRVLAHLPFDKANYRPHPKSMALGPLATHLVDLLHFQTIILTRATHDFADPHAPRPGPPPVSHEALLTRFEAHGAALRQVLATLPDEHLASEFCLLYQDRPVARLPRAAALRLMGLSHSIHHRGQLTVYLRLLNAPVPGLYGPSADEH